MSNSFQFCFMLKIGRWGIEFSRDDGFIGLWLALRSYSGNSNFSYPRWQWRPGLRWPVVMNKEQVPVFELVGVEIVPCEIIREDSWPEVIG